MSMFNIKNLNKGSRTKTAAVFLSAIFSLIFFSSSANALIVSWGSDEAVSCYEVDYAECKTAQDCSDPSKYAWTPWRTCEDTPAYLTADTFPGKLGYLYLIRARGKDLAGNMGPYDLSYVKIADPGAVKAKDFDGGPVQKLDLKEPKSVTLTLPKSASVVSASINLTNDGTDPQNRPSGIAINIGGTEAFRYNGALVLSGKGIYGSDPVPYSYSDSFQTVSGAYTKGDVEWKDVFILNFTSRLKELATCSQGVVSGSDCLIPINISSNSPGEIVLDNLQIDNVQTDFSGDTKPVALWHLDEGGGTTATDESGSYVFTFAASSFFEGSNYYPAWTDGIYGKALAFDGSNDYARAGGAFGFASGVSQAVDFTIKTSDSDGMIMTNYHDKNYKGPNWCDKNWDALGHNPWSIGLAGGKLFFRAPGYNGGGSFDITSTSAVNDGSWHFVSAVRNALEEKVKIYIDGKLEAVANFPKSGYTGTVCKTLALGTSSIGSASNSFSGTIDEIRISKPIIESSSSVSFDFPGAGFNTAARIRLPKDSVPTKASMRITGKAAGGAYPKSPAVDIGNDKIPEWSANSIIANFNKTSSAYFSASPTVDLSSFSVIVNGNTYVLIHNDTKKITNSGFESDAGWSYADAPLLPGASKAQLSGEYSTEWSSEGSRSYKIFYKKHDSSHGAAEISQQIDFTNIGRIWFDYKILGYNPTPPAMWVYIDDVVKYSMEAPKADVSVEVRDASFSPGVTGVHTLKFRYGGMVSPPSVFPFYIDNIRAEIPTPVKVGYKGLVNVLPSLLDGSNVIIPSANVKWELFEVSRKLDLKLDGDVGTTKVRVSRSFNFTTDVAGRHGYKYWTSAWNQYYEKGWSKRFCEGDYQNPTQHAALIIDNEPIKLSDHSGHTSSHTITLHGKTYNIDAVQHAHDTCLKCPPNEKCYGVEESAGDHSHTFQIPTFSSPSLTINGKRFSGKEEGNYFTFDVPEGTLVNGTNRFELDASLGRRLEADSTLKLYYKLDQGDSYSPASAKAIPITDSSGNSNDGALHSYSAVTYSPFTSGVSGNALKFRVDADKYAPNIQVFLTIDKSNFTFGPYQSLAVEFWIKTTQIGQDKYIMTNYHKKGFETPLNCDSESGTIPWSIMLEDGKIAFKIQNYADQSFSAVSAQAVNDGNWHKILVKRDAAAEQLQVYIDGALDGTASFPASGYTETKCGFVIGSNAFIGTSEAVKQFVGILDEIKISIIGTTISNVTDNLKFDIAGNHYKEGRNERAIVYNDLIPKNAHIKLKGLPLLGPQIKNLPCEKANFDSGLTGNNLAYPDKDCGWQSNGQAYCVTSYVKLVCEGYGATGDGFLLGYSNYCFSARSGGMTGTCVDSVPDSAKIYIEPNRKGWVGEAYLQISEDGGTHDDNLAGSTKVYVDDNLVFSTKSTKGGVCLQGGVAIKLDPNLFKDKDYIKVYVESNCRELVKLRYKSVMGETKDPGVKFEGRDLKYTGTIKSGEEQSIALPLKQGFGNFTFSAKGSTTLFVDNLVDPNSGSGKFLWELSGGAVKPVELAQAINAYLSSCNTEVCTVPITFSAVGSVITVENLTAKYTDSAGCTITPNYAAKVKGRLFYENRTQAGNVDVAVRIEKIYKNVTKTDLQGNFETIVYAPQSVVAGRPKVTIESVLPEVDVSYECIYDFSTEKCE